MSNAPPFDPLHPTKQEAADMMAGYMEGRGPPRPDASIAYAYGRAVRINDLNGTSEPWQHDLIRRKRQERAD